MFGIVLLNFLTTNIMRSRSAHRHNYPPRLQKREPIKSRTLEYIPQEKYFFYIRLFTVNVPERWFGNNEIRLKMFKLHATLIYLF